ncbi:hypothetical protein ACLB1N_35565 [Escherichia coli]
MGAQLSDPGNIADNADKISDDWKAFDRAVDSHSGCAADSGPPERETAGLPEHPCQRTGRGICCGGPSR